jgi:hypothetical protein
MGRLPGIAIRWAKAPAFAIHSQCRASARRRQLGERIRALDFAQGLWRASAKEIAGPLADRELMQALFNPPADNDRRQPAPRTSTYKDSEFRSSEEEMHRSVTAVTARFFFECFVGVIVVRVCRTGVYVSLACVASIALWAGGTSERS